MEMKMYEKMQLLPLFQGMSLADFSGILQTLKLDFEQYDEGDVIIQQGEPFEYLIYVLSGELDIELHCTHPSMIVAERCDRVPYVIEPYNLFSVKRNSERTYTFRTKGSTFKIHKTVFTQKLMSNPIIKSNMINYTSNLLRKMNDRSTIVVPMTVEEKIINLISQMCKIPDGRKDIRVKMDEMADCIQETRLNVSKVLNQWNDEGKITLRRSGFEIMNLGDLSAATNQ